MRANRFLFVCLLFLCPLIAHADYDGQFVSSERVATDTTEFDGNLSDSDTTVQKALETLDDMSVSATASGISADTTNFDGTLGPTDDTVQKALETLDDAIAGAGTGDVTAVGDCAEGNCLDGTNDGGTYILLYDAGGNSRIHAGAASYFMGGNVGVGTSTPASKLQVSGTVTATAFSGPLTGNVTGTATNVADADYGDVTVSSGAWAVENDSHDHATTISGKAANVSDADFGDVTVSSGAWAVEDDSHAHTTTTISGLDISADTNLTAGDHITLTDDDLDVDDDFILNTGDTASGSYNFDSNTFVVRSDLHNVGMGTSAPATKLQVSGTVTATAFSGPLTGNVTGNASGSAASITGDLDTDQLSGDTTDDNLVDDAIIAATIARDSEVSTAIATKDECTEISGCVPNAITGNQTITLSGDASGSGSTSITVTVANDSHDHATTISGKAANVSDADLGDVTISSGSWAVENDSHSHTNTTLPATTSYLGSSIDSSEITDGTVASGDINWTSVDLLDFDQQTPYRLFYSDENGDVTELSFGTSGQYLKSQGESAAPAWDTPSGTSQWDNGAGSAIYYNDGNVGVGTTNPVQKLEVVGIVKATEFVGDGSGLTGISGSGTVNTGAINAFAYYPAAGTTVDDQTALYLDSGNVGVGISTASQKLQVNGTVLATAFSGPLTGNVTGDLTGNAATSTTASTANAGDSATAFFSAGTIEHERGGLEADVSAYNGFVKISGGSTSAVTANAGTDITADLEEETHASEHSVSAADTVFPADPGADRFLVWDDDPGTLIWTTESDPLALLTAGTDNVKDTHIDWGAGAGQVNMDDLSDGSTNAVMTLTQETNFEAAYTHSTDNSQAHSDYLINNGNDTTSGNITAAGFIGVGTSITGMTLGQFDEQTAWRLFYSNADGDVTELGFGTDGQVLTSTGASTAPAFEDASGGTQEWTEAGGILAPTTGTDDVAVDTNVFYVDVSANNVGVGTSVPVNTLSVVGMVAVGTTAYTNLTSPTSGMRVEGNVGIGTTATVTSKLVVGGTSGIVSFTGVTSDPCSTAPVGSIFYNSTANVLCYCNGSNADIQVGVGSTTPCF